MEIQLGKPGMTARTRSREHLLAREDRVRTRHKAHRLFVLAERLSSGR